MIGAVIGATLIIVVVGIWDAATRAESVDIPPDPARPAEAARPQVIVVHRGLGCGGCLIVLLLVGILVFIIGPATLLAWAMIGVAAVGAAVAKPK